MNGSLQMGPSHSPVSFGGCARTIPTGPDAMPAMLSFDPFPYSPAFDFDPGKSVAVVPDYASKRRSGEILNDGNPGAGPRNLTARSGNVSS